jgi:uncharacterized phage protein (TIGR02218 family)
VTYETAELSVEGGQPFFLYEFNTPDTTYRFTSLSYQHTVNSEVWSPYPVKHSAVKQTNEISKNTVKITMPLGNDLTDLFKGYVPDFIITVNVHRGHEGETDTELYWKGRLTTHDLSNDNISFSCDSVFTSLKRYGIRARYTRACRHTLYDRGCNLEKANFSYTSYLGQVNGLLVVAPNNEADGFFTGGIIEFEDGSARFISNHSGDILTINYKSKYINETNQSVGYGLSYGEVYGAKPITIYPGCDKTLTTCDTKFDNKLNNGGFKWIPSTNPMGGSSIV